MTLKASYASSSFWVRECDGLGRAAILGLFLLNAWLVWRSFRRNDAATAIPRTVAMALGLPMLFALKRGNLIIPCFTAFVLGHGELLNRAWLRWLAIGATVNFKPYLLVTALPPLLRRRWRRFEGIGFATLSIYFLSLALQGGGDPLTLVRNTRHWADFTSQQSWGQFYYSTSYSNLLGFLSGGASILEFVGSRSLEGARLLTMLGIRIGELGVLAVLALSWRGSITVSSARLGALCLCLALTAGSPGGYAEVFLLFLVFLDRQRDRWTRIALTAAYLLCLSTDWVVVPFATGPTDSWLGSRELYSTIGVAVGQIVRPGLLLLLEYALVISTLSAIPHGGRGDHLEVPHPPPGVGPGSRGLSLRLNRGRPRQTPAQATYRSRARSRSTGRREGRLEKTPPPGPLRVQIVPIASDPTRFEVVVQQDGLVLHAKTVDSRAEAERIMLLITAGARGAATPSAA